MPSDAAPNKSHSNLITVESYLTLEDTCQNPFIQVKTFFDIFVNAGQICMGFEAATPVKLQKLAQLTRLSDKDLL